MILGFQIIALTWPMILAVAFVLGQRVRRLEKQAGL
jgi:hypothetical protein